LKCLHIYKDEFEAELAGFVGNAGNICHEEL